MFNKTIRVFKRKWFNIISLTTVSPYPNPKTGAVPLTLRLDVWL